MGWDWEWGAGATAAAAACWWGDAVEWVTGALGVAPVIAVVLGSALIDVVVVPSIAHLAVITAAATPSPIKLGDSILGPRVL